MGRKKSKNAGATGKETLTYHERKQLGYGTSNERLGKVCKNRTYLRGCSVNGMTECMTESWS